MIVSQTMHLREQYKASGEVLASVLLDNIVDHVVNTCKCANDQKNKNKI